MELVLRICKFAVVQNATLLVNRDDDDATQRDNPSTVDQPAISKVNRLLRSECLKLFCTENVFHGYNYEEPSVTDWLRAIGESNWKLLKTLTTAPAFSGDVIALNWAAHWKIRLPVDGLTKSYTVSGRTVCYKVNIETAQSVHVAGEN